MKRHKTAPTITVSGFVRFNDRTGPMAAGTVGCPQFDNFCVLEAGSGRIRKYWRLEVG